MLANSFVTFTFPMILIICGSVLFMAYIWLRDHVTQDIRTCVRHNVQYRKGSVCPNCAANYEAMREKPWLSDETGDWSWPDRG